MGGCRTHWIENPSDWVGKAFVRGDGSMREQFVIGIDFRTDREGRFWSMSDPERKSPIT